VKLLLVYPNADRELIGWGDLGAIAEPLALEYVAAAARADGHDVEILDLRLHPGRLPMKLWGMRPDVVGFTGYSMHVLRNLELAKLVREVVPEARTIVGGHHATLMPEDFFEPQIDFIAVGEGSNPLRALLAALEGGDPAVALPGLWSRRDGGGFRFGGEAGAFDIDAVAPPDRTLVPMDRPRYFIDWMQPIALLRTTVGCPYRCSFCSLWRIMDGRYYRRDVGRVVDELATIDEPYVFLVDDEPFVNPSRMHEMARAIRSAGIRKEYFAYCRVDSFLRDRALMEEWRAIGLRRLFFGIETIFDDELADYNKRQEKGQIQDAVRIARDLDIQLFCSFIVKPEYGAERFAQIVDFIREQRIEYPSFTILTPIPGTPACATFDRIVARQPNGRPDWSRFNLQHAVTPTAIPHQEFMAHYRGLQSVFAESYRAAGHPMFQPPASAEAPSRAEA
jgi:radical SAM superfamily enzyme YgiQ (UPF0313 family)